MIDLLLGGSPCQGFSFAGKQLNFFDPRSKLFFEYVKALEMLKPKYFLLENVKMKKEYQDVISKHLGVEPVEINSALVSAQNRVRLYWTNIPNIQQPDDKGIYLKDIIDVANKSYRPLRMTEIQKATIHKANSYYQYDMSGKGYNSQQDRCYSLRGKINTLSASRSITKVNVLFDDGFIRAMTPDEIESCQTLPKGYTYTQGLSDNKRDDLIGNGWTVDVIAHILRHITDTYFQTVVSLFDGISCGQVALERAGKTYNQYYASEIDKYAIQVTQKNYPHTMQLGDITKIDWTAFLDRLNMIQKVS